MIGIGNPPSPKSTMKSLSPSILHAIEHLAQMVREGELAEFLSNASEFELASFFTRHESDIRTIAGMCRIVTRAVDEDDEQL
jgi:hypothetical protein